MVIEEDTVDESIVEVTVADVLRDQVEIRQGPLDKTIITFEYAYDLSVKKKKRDYYTFVSVWIADKGRWFNSGTGSGVPRDCEHEALMKIVASAHVKSASVVTALEAFKP